MEPCWDKLLSYGMAQSVLASTLLTLDFLRSRSQYSHWIVYTGSIDLHGCACIQVCKYIPGWKYTYTPKDSFEAKLF